jgi:hypothetical protein
MLYLSAIIAGLIGGWLIRGGTGDWPLSRTIQLQAGIIFTAAAVTTLTALAASWLR